jgi:hypothetical protein
MSGLIWFVQVVQYPLFAAVHAGGFRASHSGHMPLTQQVVVLPMVIATVTSIAPVWMVEDSILRVLRLPGAALWFDAT